MIQGTPFGQRSAHGAAGSPDEAFAEVFAGALAGRAARASDFERARGEGFMAEPYTMGASA